MMISWSKDLLHIDTPDRRTRLRSNDLVLRIIGIVCYCGCKDFGRVGAVAVSWLWGWFGMLLLPKEEVRIESFKLKGRKSRRQKGRNKVEENITGHSNVEIDWDKTAGTTNIWKIKGREKERERERERERGKSRLRKKQTDKLPIRKSDDAINGAPRDRKCGPR